jgi:hypothetical protein
LRALSPIVITRSEYVVLADHCPELWPSISMEVGRYRVTLAAEKA